MRDEADLFDYEGPTLRSFSAPSRTQDFVINDNYSSDEYQSFFKFNIGLKSELIEISRKTDTIFDLLG